MYIYIFVETEMETTLVSRGWAFWGFGVRLRPWGIYPAFYRGYVGDMRNMALVMDKMETTVVFRFQGIGFTCNSSYLQFHESYLLIRR